MSWVVVGVAGTTAVMSYMNNQQAKKRDQANMEANAEAMRYSPWTGMKTEMKGPTANSDMGAALQGGLQGASFASQFKGASPSSTPSAQAAPASDAETEAAGGFAPGTFAQERQAMNQPAAAAQPPGQPVAMNGNPYSLTKKPLSFYK